MASVLVIARQVDPGFPDIVPGSLLWVGHDFSSANRCGRWWLVCQASVPHGVGRMQDWSLLPVTEAFQRQPEDNYWALVHQDRSKRGLTCFLSHVDRGSVGPAPHRFESLGECLYYMRSRLFRANPYQVAHITSYE